MGGALRVLFLLNAFVAGSVLVAMLARSGLLHEVEAAELGVTAEVKFDLSHRIGWGASDPRAMPDLMIEFGEPMVGRDAIGTPVAEVPVQLDPPQSLRVFWRAYDRLEVVPDHPLERATRYRLCLDPALRTLSGKPLRELEFRFETPEPRFLGTARLVPGLVRTLVAPGTGLPRARARFGDSLEAKDLRGWELRFDLPFAAEVLDGAAEVLVGGEPSAARSIDEWPDVDGAGAAPGTRFVLLVDGAALAGRRQATAVELLLHAGLRARGHDVPTSSDLVQVLETVGGVTGDGERRTRLPRPDLSWEDGQLRLDFGRQLPLPADGMLSFEPAVDVQVQEDWRGLRVTGPFPAGEAVELRLAEGFPGYGAARLEGTLRVPLRVPDLPARVAFASDGRILSALARPELELVCSNVERVVVSLRTMYANNLVGYSRRWHDEAVWGGWRQERVALAGPRNEEFHHRLDLGALLGDRRVGLHEVEVRAVDAGGRALSSDRHVVQVTDLGLSARVRDDAVAVRVYGLAKGAPVEGAEVRVHTPSQQVLAEGRTDADGLALLRFPKAHDDRRPFVVEARYGEDRCFVDPRACGVELYEDAQRGRPWPGEQLEAWLGSDRGIVRPGGTLRLCGLVRDAAGRAPLGAALVLEWRDSAGRLAASESIEAPPSGMWCSALAVADDAPTGAWHARVLHDDVEVGRLAFRVDAFVPDRLEASFAPLVAKRVDDGLELALEARWLEGTPAADRPVLVHLRYDRGAGAPAGLEDWSFGPLERGPASGALPPFELRTGPDGRVRIPVPAPHVLGPDPYVVLSARAEVQDPSGRPVRCALRQRLAVREPLLGLKVLAARAAEPSLVALRFADAAGAEARPDGGTMQVAVRVERQTRSWRQVYERNRLDWRRTTERFLVHATTCEVGAVPVEVEIPALPPADGGRYVVVAEAGPYRVEAPLGSGRLPDTRLALTAPPDPVAPGAEARLGVESPFAGSALLTLEGESIVALRRVDLVEGHNEVVVPVPAATVTPNLHVVLSLTRPMAGNRDPYWCVGSTPLRVERPGSAVAVALRLPALLEPGRDLEVEVTAPGARRAVAWAVDEGILRLTAHPAPDPAGFFAALRRLEGRGLEAGRTLYGAASFPREVVEGGGSGVGLGPRLAGSISSRIRPVALATGLLDLDADGRGTARLHLPDHYEGRLRVVVVAAGERGAGAAAEPLRVEAPLGLRLALPRMLVPGDESTAVLSLANRSGVTGRVVVDLEPLGGARLLPAPDLVEVDGRWRLERALGDGETADVDLAFVAGAEPGGQGLRASARLDRLARALEARCDVRSPSVYAVERMAFTVDGERRLEVPGTWTGGGPKATLSVGLEPGLQLVPALESLLSYPYGCVEQTTSRAFAVLGSSALLARLGKGAVREAGGAPLRGEACVEAGIRRLFAMQRPEGGLAAWPGGQPEVRFGSLYALDFLLEAERQGFTLPAEGRRALLDRVERWLRHDDDPSVRAYALQLLLEAGRPLGGFVELVGREAVGVEDRLRL
ncbi:MAG: MG2 domain-containing protein, partial [Planctomycetota bacterium]